MSCLVRLKGQNTVLQRKRQKSTSNTWLWMRLIRMSSQLCAKEQQSPYSQVYILSGQVVQNLVLQRSALQRCSTRLWARWQSSPRMQQSASFPGHISLLSRRTCRLRSLGPWKKGHLLWLCFSALLQGYTLKQSRLRCSTRSSSFLFFLRSSIRQIPYYSHRDLQIPRFAMLILCWKVAAASIVVYSPGTLKDKLGDVAYSIANFGDIPFGKTIMGPLVPVVGMGCEDSAFDQVGKHQNAVVLVDRGNCTFTTKVKNAQRHGAKLVIIEDGQDHDYKITMADDGHGYNVKLPSIFINKSSGQKLRHYSKVQEVVLQIHFEFPSSAVSKLDLNLDLADRLSFVMLEEVGYTYKRISSHLSVELHYYLYTSANNEKDCFGKGLYCGRKDAEVAFGSGRDYLLQILRQYFIAEEDLGKFFQYTVRFNDRCTTNYLRAEECSQQVCKELSIDFQKVKAKVDKSFSQGKPDKDATNKVLQKMLDYNSKFYNFPSLYVNNQSFQGTLRDQNILEMACAGLQQAPSSCSSNGLRWYQILAVVVGVILLVLVLASVFRIMMRRKQTPQKQINSMVSQYVQFYSSKA